MQPRAFPAVFCFLVALFTTETAPAQRGPATAADRPVPRTDPNSKLAHQQMLANLKKGRIDVYFAGDSITRRWRATDYPQFLANWNENFFGWNAANFGWGGDTIQNILWRLRNGELDGVHPKVIVLLAGTNNVGTAPASDARVSAIARGIKALLDTMREKAPKATIIVMGILPRNDGARLTAVMASINKINEQIAKLTDGKTIRYLNINDNLADKDGKLLAGMSADRLHLSRKGYQVWADALKPLLTELLGPPAKEDYAPPPTGDPSAAKKKAAADRIFYAPAPGGVGKEGEVGVGLARCGGLARDRGRGKITHRPGDRSSPRLSRRSRPAVSFEDSGCKGPQEQRETKDAKREHTSL
jgi:lysophospholipase L1-like esterase